MFIHICMYTYVWEYPSKSYTSFPRVKIAKTKDMATWLESGTKATAQCPCPRFLNHSTVRHTDTDTPEQTDRHSVNNARLSAFVCPQASEDSRIQNHEGAQGPSSQPFLVVSNSGEGRQE